MAFLKLPDARSAVTFSRTQHLESAVYAVFCCTRSGEGRVTRVRFPKGIRMVVGHELTFEVKGIAVRP